MMKSTSQELLGDKLGLTFQQIQKYEKGVNRIAASRLYMMASIFDVSIDYFFEDMPIDLVSFSVPQTPTADQNVMQFVRSSEGLQLNAAFARITGDKTRTAIVNLVKTLPNGGSRKK